MITSKENLTSAATPSPLGRAGVGLLLFYIFFVSNLVAQTNLVPNPSFDVLQTNDSCYSEFTSTQIIRPWSEVSLGTNCFIFDSCSYYGAFRVPYTFAGYQIPHSGKSMASLGTYCDTTDCITNPTKITSRNFPFTKLTQTLSANKVYNVAFYVNLYNIMYKACNNMGAYFSADSLTDGNINLLTQNIFPQINNNPITNPLTDTANWTLVSGCFTANGTERYITIGNFISQYLCNTTILSNLSTNNTVYFLDDVSVIELRANAFADDTLICSNTGFTKKLRVYDGMHNILWSTGDSTQSITVNQAGKYWVTATNECGTVTDTITIHLRNPNAYKFNLGNDVLYCNSISKQLSIINPNLHNIVWSTGDTIPSITLSLPSGGVGGGFTIWATAQSECGLQTDTIIITKATIPNNLITQTDTTIYVGDTITITAIDGLEQYEWSSGEITNSILFSAPSLLGRVGVGLLAYTQDGCLATDSITIKTIAKPVVELPIIYPSIIHKSKEKLVFKNLPDGATVNIYNSLGQNIPYNTQSSAWAEGVYYYVVRYEEFEVVRKLVVLE